MTDVNDADKARKLAALKAKMAGALPGGGSPVAGAPPPPAAPAASGGFGAGVGGQEMAARIAAAKARAAGLAPPSAPAAAASAPAAAAPATGGTADVVARVAALKAKMEAGKSAAPAAARPAAPAKKVSQGTSKPVFPVDPINTTSFGDERLYGGSTLGKWFTLSAAALLVLSLWMWKFDGDRDWKDWQSIKRERDIEMLEATIAKKDQSIDQAHLAELKSQVAAAAASVAARQDEIERLTEEQDRLEGVAYKTNQEYQFAKSEFDAKRYDFEELRLAHGGDEELLATSRAELQAMKADMDEKRRLADNAAAGFADSKAKVAGLLALATTAEKALAEMTGERELLQARLDKIGHNLFNDRIRNAPVADMLVPTLKVDQIVLEDLKDNYNFMHVGKVDRCTTCHVGIDNPDFAGWDDEHARTEHTPAGERVLNAHPRLDLFVGDTSPHPKGRFGCTVCHLGRGQAVEFPRTFHVPAADAGETREQKQERWTRDFGYDPTRHYWDFPMTPSDKLYSSCFQCHSATDRLQGVPEYNRPRETVERLGCYGCHKIEGFEHLRKVGPDLSHLAAKTTEEWTAKWVMSPKSFRPTTRMPHFWNQSNTGARADAEAYPGRTELTLDLDVPWNNEADEFVPDWRARNEVEARAVVAYVWGRSKEKLAQDGYAPLTPPKTAGDAARGQELFEDRGCLGCHSLEREQQLANDHGPDLSSIGSKVAAPWLYSWILDPKSYFPTTNMPDLRLSEQEAWDITAYLLSLKSPEWEEAPAPARDAAILEAIALEYLGSLQSIDAARTDLAALRSRGGEAAVEQYVGDKLFNRFGCAGCHLVPGHEEDMGVGTELTYEALKELSKFDFGFEAAHDNPRAIGHSMVDWFERKLTDPRSFDRMPVVAGGDAHAPHGGHIERFDQKVKAPGDKLKMPNYYLTPQQVDDVGTFLLGLRRDGIDESMRRHLGPEEQMAEKASRLMTAKNCTGCHRLGQVADRVPMDEAALEEGLEYGLWMAKPLVVEKRTLLATHDWLNDEVYDPWNEEDTLWEDLLEEHPVQDELVVYGHGEGGMGSYIEEAALRPPTLRNEAQKVNPDWLFAFLYEPYTVRTHVEVRMPTFGFSEDEARVLAQWFSLRDGEPWPFATDPHAVADPELLQKGADLFANVFQCNKCHPAGGKDPPNPDKTNWGPNLELAAERLKMDWVAEWIMDAQRMQPGTKMPSILGTFRNGQFRPAFEDWEERQAALVHYLRHMEQAPAPAPTARN